MTRSRGQPGPRRRKLGRAMLAIGTVVFLSLGDAATPSTANWVDEEWAAASASVVDCAATTDYATAASSTLLQADVLGIPLESIASVVGLSATDAPGAEPVVDPLTALDLGSGAFAEPLGVAVLNEALAVDLTGVLSIPLGADVGLLNQYVRVGDDGRSVAATGAVTNTGAVDLVGADPGPDAPTVATLSLDSVVSAVLGPGAADLVAEVTALDLALGAFASIAELDACASAFSQSAAAALVRDYLVAGLDLDVDSPLVADLSAAVSAATVELEGELGELTDANASLLSSVTAGVSTLLSGVLGGLTLGSIDIALTATWNLSVVDALLDDTISDPGGLVVIDLAAGTVAVDLAAVVDATNGLNALDPNSEVLLDAAMIEAIENAVTAALAAWVADVDSALDAALDAVTLTGSVTIDILSAATPVLRATLALSNASLAALVADAETSPEAVLTVQTLGLVSCPAPTNPLDPGFSISSTVCPLVPDITAALEAGLQGVVGSSVIGLLTPITSDLDATLDSLTDATTSPLVRLVAALADGVLGVDGAASLLINVQNAPVSGGPAPPDWADIAAGRFDVAALRLGVLGLVGGDDLDVVLARSSVGPNALDLG